MTDLCGCCEGLEKITPELVANRPGLDRLAYRVGTHSTFLDTMVACLTDHHVTISADEVGSWLLEEADLVDPVGLALKLKDGRDEVSAHLLAGLSESTLELLGRLEDSPPSVEELGPALVKDLNQRIRGVSLYDAERFSHLTLTADLTDLVTDENLSADELQRLNRLLLELAYRNDLEKRLRTFPLRRLTTRDAADPTIALLDAWATVGDVLTFYQERLANEGYLPTATERRSILELARLVGYSLRPGVASSVYLAFTLEKGHDVEIPAGNRAQSAPGPGELPQSFETSEPLAARAEWNVLVPRLRRPQRLLLEEALTRPYLYLKGTATLLEPNDPLLLVFGSGSGRQVLRRVASIEADQEADRTLVKLQAPSIVALGRGFVESVRAIAVRHRELDAFGVSGTTGMARRVVKHLEELTRLADSQSPEALAAFLRETALPELQAEHRAAREGGYTRLEPWLASLTSDLSEQLAMTPSGSARSTPATPTARRLPRASPIDEARFREVTRAAFAKGFTALDAFRELELSEPLSRPPTVQPANSLRLERSIGATYALDADALPKLLAALQPAYDRLLYQALGAAELTPPQEVEVYALRTTARLFGHNAPQRPLTFDRETGEILTTGEWPVVEEAVVAGPSIVAFFGVGRSHEDPEVVHLDAPYENVLPDSWLVVETRETSLTTEQRLVAKAGNPDASLSRADYGISSGTTRIELLDPADPSARLRWITADLETHDPNANRDFQAIRTTKVYAESERLELAEEPILDPEAPPEAAGLRPVRGQTVELGELYEGLESGRWLVVSGERSDISGVTALRASELVMLAGVAQVVDSTLPGDKLHTILMLAGEGLAYEYKRDTVKVYGNVVKATHGETRRQILGSGDGGAALQRFDLTQSPLTFVSAPTARGVETTLEVRVNDVRWHEAESLVELGPTDRRYVTRIDDEAKTTVIFGDGKRGARLPTGGENVTSVYRKGIGTSGNVDSESISLLADRPLGVKEVINPLPAAGGADPESRDQARKNAPLAVTALDRLVSVQDYADFTRTFAGIGKAGAELVSDGRRRVLRLTIAGADDIPIDPNSDLYRNLRQALLELGDPALAIQIDLRELLLVVVSATVRIDADHRWESVEPRIRSALVEALGFERRELGQDVTLSEVIAAIQSVRGVTYVDVDVLDFVTEESILDPDRSLAEELGLRPRIHVGRGQLAYLDGEVPETLLLSERTE